MDSGHGRSPSLSGRSPGACLPVASGSRRVPDHNDGLEAGVTSSWLECLRSLARSHPTNRTKSREGEYLKTMNEVYSS